MPHQSPYHVRAVHCDHRADDEQVYAALKRATAPLDAAWAKLKAARTITIKFNHTWDPNHIVYHPSGLLQEHVDTKVARATLRLLRENTHAEIRCCDTHIYGSKLKLEDTLLLGKVLREFDVPFVEGDHAPRKAYQVPGGGAMFKQYVLPEPVVDTDAFVSVQKMKNHVFMGVTLCLKNLFGLCPMAAPLGRARQYFHHIIRLSYVLGDLGRLVNPTLSIIDGLVGQAKREWGGEGRIANTLVAGDQVVATDACGAYLMGHDPQADWPTPPFLRDRNALRVAAEGGFGTVKLDEIDFQSEAEVKAPVAEFSAKETDPDEMVAAWRRTTCEQALYYRDHAKELIAKYAGEYILLQDNEVKWHDKSSYLRWSRRDISGAHKDHALWLKKVDPEEAEGEHFEVYEQVLAQMKEMGL